MELVFTQGAMQQLQTLKLSFIVQDITRQYGDLGLENLSSLGHVSVEIYLSDGQKNAESDVIPEDEMPKNVFSAMQKALNMNPNKPTLEVKHNPRDHLEVTNQFTLSSGTYYSTS
jgi:hypothetical protein